MAVRSARNVESTEAAVAALRRLTIDRGEDALTHVNDDIADAIVNVARELMLLVSHIARTDPGKQDASNDAEPREAARIPVYRDTIFQALSKLCTSVVCNSREIERLNAIITRLPSARAGDLATTRMLSSIDNGGPEVSVSRREREVLIQLFGGKTNREISRELGISEKTVKNHLWRIYRKLGVDNRTQLFHRLISA